jgi:flagellin
MVINTNIAADNSTSVLESSSAKLSKALQELSSGSKLNSASDNPAGMAVSMQLSAQSGDITAVQGDLSNATSFTQTQDGYLQQVSTALNQMSQLAVSAQDSTITGQDASLYNAEFQQLGSYIANVAEKEFNGVSLFAGSAMVVTIDTGVANNTWSMGTVNMGSTSAYAALSNGTENITTTSAAGTALAAVTDAINQLAQDRGTVGANETRLNYTSNQLAVEQTNVQAANSAISDVDVAQETTNYAQLAVLVQSGTAMLAQANALPQNALKLIMSL